jgi:TldD protein
MKVNKSTYLDNNKTLVKQLVAVLSEDFKYVSILGTDCVGKRYGLKRTGVELNDSMWSERGFVARVYNGINYSEYSFNEFNEDNLSAVADRIRKTATGMNQLMTDSGIQITNYDVLEEAFIAKTF